MDINSHTAFCVVLPNKVYKQYQRKYSFIELFPFFLNSLNICSYLQSKSQCQMHALHLCQRIRLETKRSQMGIKHYYKKQTCICKIFYSQSSVKFLIRKILQQTGEAQSCCSSTALQPVFKPFSQLVPQLELYSQLQLSLWSDPIAFSVPKSTW